MSTKLKADIQISIQICEEINDSVDSIEKSNGFKIGSEQHVQHIKDIFSQLIMGELKKSVGSITIEASNIFIEEGKPDEVQALQ